MLSPAFMSTLTITLVRGMVEVEAVVVIQGEFVVVVVEDFTNVITDRIIILMDVGRSFGNQNWFRQQRVILPLVILVLHVQ